MKNNSLHYCRIVFLIIAIIFIVNGLVKDEHLVVLKKASNICLECIGID